MSETPEPERYRSSLDDTSRRIERFLVSATGATQDHVSKLLRQGRVRAGTRVFGRGDRLDGGELVEIHPGPKTRPAPLPNRKIKLTVLYEDGDVIGILKPSGMAMHPGPGHSNDTLQNALIGRYPALLELGEEREYGLAHRLDLDTSGVLLVGRSEAGYAGLVEAFKAREVEKEYLAIVVGTPPGESGMISSDVDEKSAQTEYELTERAGDLSLLTLRPKSGRKHQVRVHLASVGCPVLADWKHGHGLDAHTAQLYLKRLALHARKISLKHPISGEPLTLEAEWPKALRKAWRRAKNLAAPPTNEQSPDALA